MSSDLRRAAAIDLRRTSISDVSLYSVQFPSLCDMVRRGEQDVGNIATFVFVCTSCQDIHEGIEVV